MRFIRLSLFLLLSAVSYSYGQNIDPSYQIAWPSSCVSGTQYSPYSNSCTANGLFNPAQWSASDFGAKINQAIAATAAGSGVSGYGAITLPPGSYTYSTTISLAGYPNIILDCQGANLTYTGSTIAVDALQPVGATNSSGGIRNCNFYAPSTAIPNVTVIRFGNVLNYKIHHNSAWNFYAAGDVGILVENTTYFTEDSIIDDNQMRQVTVGYEFQKNCSGSGCTGSAEYTFFHSNYWNSPYTNVSGAIGLYITGGMVLQNSVVELHANINGPSGGNFINIATSSDQILRDQVALNIEYDALGSGNGTCVVNNGTFIANGTFTCEAATTVLSGNGYQIYGSDGGVLGNESEYASAQTVVNGSVAGTQTNLLPDSEHTLGTTYWQAPSGSLTIGHSPLNSGHTDYGYWNTSGSTQTCLGGQVTSQPLSLPAGTYTVSAFQATSGTTTTGCGSSYANLAVFNGSTNIANQYGPRMWNSPITFTLASAASITLQFVFAGQNFPSGAYIEWNSPQIEQGTITTTYKQSVIGGGVSQIPTVGTPTVGQAACIKAAGPPVVLGYCSTVPGSGGACTCN